MWSTEATFGQLRPTVVSFLSSISRAKSFPNGVGSGITMAKFTGAMILQLARMAPCMLEMSITVCVSKNSFHADKFLSRLEKEILDSLTEVPKDIDETSDEEVLRTVRTYR